MPSTQNDLIDGISTSVAVKAPCRVYAVAGITLSGLQTIDSVVLAANDRVLVNGQTDQTTNGIYIASSLNWSRAPDFDGARDAANGTRVFIAEGTTYQNRVFRLDATDPVGIGSSAIIWVDVTQDATSIPGGTNGQIQYNNSGTLGGFTASGDFTVDTATGIGTLANTGVSAQQYGAVAKIPIITVDAKGRITAASAVTIAQVPSPYIIPATMVLNDQNAGVTTNSASAIGITIPAHAGVPMEVGCLIPNQQLGVGVGSYILGAGVTSPQGAGPFVCTKQYGTIWAWQQTTNVWTFFGDI